MKISAMGLVDTMRQFVRKLQKLFAADSEVVQILTEEKEKKDLKDKKGRKPFVGKIDRYIIKKFLGTYFFSIALIMAIATIFDFNERIDKFTSSHATWHEIIFDYYLNFIPYLANLFSALFVFISVIIFTTKLADNSEIIALHTLKDSLLLLLLLFFSSFLFLLFLLFFCFFHN